MGPSYNLRGVKPTKTPRSASAGRKAPTPVSALSYGADVQARLAAVFLAAETAASGQVDDPAAAMDIIYPLLAGREMEATVAVAVNNQMRLIEADIITVGSAGFTVVCPMQILRWVLTRKKPAYGFFLAHNHPSGDPTPSLQDNEVTQRLNTAARAVGIKLVDHLIVTNDRKVFTSYRALGTIIY